MNIKNTRQITKNTDEKCNKLFSKLTGRTGITDLLVYMYYAHSIVNELRFIDLDIFSNIIGKRIGYCTPTVKNSIRRLTEYGLLIPNKKSHYKLIPVSNSGHLEFFEMEKDIMKILLEFSKQDIFKFGKRGLGKSGMMTWLKFLNNENPISKSELIENSFVSKQTGRKKIKQMLKHKLITQNESGYVKGKFYFSFDEVLIKMQKSSTF